MENILDFVFADLTSTKIYTKYKEEVDIKLIHVSPTQSIYNQSLHRQIFDELKSLWS